MSSQGGFGTGSPKSFRYPRGGGDFDLESGSPRKGRKPKNPHLETSIVMRIRYFYEAHPVAVALLLLSFGLSVLILLSVYETRFRTMRSGGAWSSDGGEYPFPKLRNLVMVAGHSIYTSSRCGETESENSWFLEPYQKHPGQAATFLAHIKEGVGIVARDEGALLLFSGGETRRDAGPRSEAQSYWAIAESKGWFGNDESVRSRALTEEHARDSFENLLFSVCRFRELTGRYPQNITVVSYDFKEERFAQLHRTALGFPEGRFFFTGTPATPSAREAALKGEAAVRSQFLEDPYGCLGSLHVKRLKRDPFHRTIPYPDGCPELKGLFSYCGPVPYSGHLPWTE
ncbi:hypothetical protein BDA96_06G096000 [Sorghum bicolor]|uniref:DUF218 domain-containing protein n=2 Tax=Sorghum bicolor TaxID=4558 RepID=A0A921UBW5_SORBI|nr:uncharacterized protein C57A10.07 [Sorghum bicolor]EES10844.1 hypothetical protein SORBI_3006G087400 [Sorghum bicolor]KAG0525883.1 hypothetical protein BDA96_06G096000 [Sorghum bicolor]|eukprot:XP_002446516.1 uncharacterized protein C57A10.07 [Sorghum bicolor]